MYMNSDKHIIFYPFFLAKMQGKQWQIPDCYGSYKTISERKELMLKKRSLLNSIILEYILGNLGYLIEFFHEIYFGSL